MDLNVQVSEELVIGVSVPAELGMNRVEFDFEAFTEEELRALLVELGGLDAWRYDPSSPLMVRYGVPVTWDGEQVMTATLHVWLREEPTLPEQVRFPAIARLRDEQKVALDAAVSRDGS